MGNKECSIRHASEACDPDCVRGRLGGGSQPALPGAGDATTPPLHYANAEEEAATGASSCLEQPQYWKDEMAPDTPIISPRHSRAAPDDESTLEVEAAVKNASADMDDPESSGPAEVCRGRRGRSKSEPIDHKHTDDSNHSNHIEAGPAAGARCYFDLDVGEASPEADAASFMRVRLCHRFRSGANYDGEWMRGKRDGAGRQAWSDGTEYVGQWRRGRGDGIGHLRHGDGDTYAGQWVKGRAHGWGTYRFQNSDAVYAGRFRYDLRDGAGVETWVDGSCYMGEFKQGDKAGVGEYRWPDGTSYVGSWQANRPSGAGTYSLADGSVYRGQWAASKPHGAGMYEWASGDSYQGQYHYDKRHGFGIFTSPTSRCYTGFWTQGVERHKHRHRQNTDDLYI